VKDILQPNPDFLAVLVVATYLLAGYSLYRHTFTENDIFRRAVWPITIVGTAFIFKISMAGEAGELFPIWLQHIQYSWSWAATLVTKARISFGAIAFGMVWYCIRWLLDSKGHGPWISEAFGFVNLFLLGQTKYVDIPLFLLFEGQRLLLEKSNADDRWLAMTCLWMQHVSFFALGNSNSLSSIDLSNAYNGISSYSIPLVGALTFISNWAGPIWWALAAIRFMSEARRGQVRSKTVGMDRYADWMAWCAWFHGVVMCFLVGACIVLRTHLFIWTVFSPKFLFQAVWMGFEHIVIESIVGGIIWCIG
jgi:ethanolamine phosphate transferase 2 subunit G